MRPLARTYSSSAIASCAGIGCAATWRGWDRTGAELAAGDGETVAATATTANAEAPPIKASR